MATTVGTKRPACPRCGVEATVRTWSCTCQTVSKATHRESLTAGGAPHTDFNAYHKDCGARGKPETH